LFGSFCLFVCGFAWLVGFYWSVCLFGLFVWFVGLFCLSSWLVCLFGWLVWMLVFIFVCFVCLFDLLVG
jgi:hypothetical protein